MKINKYEWQFNIDSQKTKSMYANRVDSVIDTDRQLPELVNFFNELGIDIKKPDKYSSDLSDVIYTCIGTVESEYGYEIDMYGEGEYISIAIYNKDGIVTFEVFGIR